MLLFFLGYVLVIDFGQPWPLVDAPLAWVRARSRVPSWLGSLYLIVRCSIIKLIRTARRCLFVGYLLSDLFALHTMRPPPAPQKRTLARRRYVLARKL